MSDIFEFLKQCENASVVPVVATMPADLLTPLSVYLKLSAGTANSFVLESVEGGKSLARYSFIGSDPEMVLNGSETTVTVSTPDGDEPKQVGTIKYLRSHFASRHAPVDADLPSFISGAIGYLGFACSEWFEPSLKRTGTSRSDV